MSISEAYNSWASQYDSNENKTRDLDKIATIKTLSKYDFNKVLELGCGTGKNTKWLIGKAETVVGIDFSKNMLQKAKEKITSNKVTFLQADITKKWSFKNESFDLITSSLTLEHIKNLDFIYKEAHQKLKQDGLFFICELHPFKKYIGSKARFETENGTEELEVYTHHISEFMQIAKKNHFNLITLNEWFDEDNSEFPRLISFVFKKY